jgi:cholesterol oxidase
VAGLPKDAYEAIVVGTGFGGAVTACRLAQAGVDVAVIERGARFELGAFPRVGARIDEMSWHRGGPYDVRPLNDVLVVQAAGYGGGSLIYANVQMRPPADAFDDGWPAGYSRTALDADYDLVAHMLDIRPVEKDPATGELPRKTRLMEEAATRLGRSAQFFQPNLAVRFEGAGEAPTPNRFGAPQSGCLHCGECDIGCNVGAKNTLDLNYLAVAERFGADVATRAELAWLASEGEGYRIRFRDRDAGAERSLLAREVFLCMGAVSTTEFLLRCRDQFKTLPRLSPKLGSGYSGNGDFLAFGLGASPPFSPTKGPTITTACVFDDDSDGRRRRFILEEGGVSPQGARLLPLLHPIRLAQLAARELEDRVAHHAHSFASRVEHEREETVVLLVMGRDRANGSIELTRPHHRLRVRWDTRSNLALYASETAACRELVTALGGELALSPNWRFLGQPSSVHNLGGCRMAAGPADGVVDPRGEVFGYPGLRVLDGAIIPGAVGVNPSHTIAAVAERCVEDAIRHRPGYERWQAPERASAARPTLPEDRVSIPPGGTAAPAVPGGALHWSETMTGACALEGVTRATSFDVTILVPDVPAFVADPAHPAPATGRVRVEGLTEPEGSPVDGGSFHLFLSTGDPRERTMVYELPFHASDNRPWLLRGLKHVRGHRIADFWRATTTLETRLAPREGAGATGRGTLRLGIRDVVRLIASMRPVRGGRPSDTLTAYWEFVRFYAGTIVRLYVAGKRARRS